jgi:hypothetical protein
VRCFTRNLHDWSDRVPHLVRALKALPVRSCYLDGEAIMPREHRSSDWCALRAAFARRDTARVCVQMFDVMEIDCRDLPRTRGVSICSANQHLEQLNVAYAPDGATPSTSPAGLTRKVKSNRTDFHLSGMD